LSPLTVESIEQTFDMSLWFPLSAQLQASAVDSPADNNKQFLCLYFW
jgi:hypothetical protein